MAISKAFVKTVYKKRRQSSGIAGCINIKITTEIKKNIERLKREKNAVILTHVYQPVDIQDIADYIGDSLDLSKKAVNTNADAIVFLRSEIYG